MEKPRTSVLGLEKLKNGEQKLVTSKLQNKLQCAEGVYNFVSLVALEWADIFLLNSTVSFERWQPKNSEEAKGKYDKMMKDIRVNFPGERHEWSDLWMYMRGFITCFEGFENGMEKNLSSILRDKSRDFCHFDFEKCWWHNNVQDIKVRLKCVQILYKYLAIMIREWGERFIIQTPLEVANFSFPITKTEKHKYIDMVAEMERLFCGNYLAWNEIWRHLKGIGKCFDGFETAIRELIEVELVDS